MHCKILFVLHIYSYGLVEIFTPSESRGVRGISASFLKITALNIILCLCLQCPLLNRRRLLSCKSWPQNAECAIKNYLNPGIRTAFW